VAALLAGVVVLVAAATQGSLAFFQQQASAGDAVTLQAGSAGLDLSTVTWATPPTLYPGADATGSTTLTNTGDVPLGLTPSVAVTAGAGPFAAAVHLTAWLVAPGATCGTPAGDIWSATTSSTSGSLPDLAAGASQRLCLRVALQAGAAGDTQVSATPSLNLTLTGDQHQS
jgi:hypothetical protein